MLGSELDSRVAYLIANLTLVSSKRLSTEMANRYRKNWYILEYLQSRREQMDWNRTTAALRCQRSVDPSLSLRECEVIFSTYAAHAIVTKNRNKSVGILVSGLAFCPEVVNRTRMLSV